MADPKKPITISTKGKDSKPTANEAKAKSLAEMIINHDSSITPYLELGSDFNDATLKKAMEMLSDNGYKRITGRLDIGIPYDHGTELILTKVEPDQSKPMAVIVKGFNVRVLVPMAYHSVKETEEEGFKEVDDNDHPSISLDLEEELNDSIALGAHLLCKVEKYGVTDSGYDKKIAVFMNEVELG